MIAIPSHLWRSVTNLMMSIWALANECKRLTQVDVAITHNWNLVFLICNIYCLHGSNARTLLERNIIGTVGCSVGFTVQTLSGRQYRPCRSTEGCDHDALLTPLQVCESGKTRPILQSTVCSFIRTLGYKLVEGAWTRYRSWNIVIYLTAVS